jgi:hypothetical protein
MTHIRKEESFFILEFFRTSFSIVRENETNSSSVDPIFLRYTRNLKRAL